MALKGLAQDEAIALFTRVHTMLTTESDDDAPPPEVGKLAVLSGVWAYPTRVKCATLAWQALRSACQAKVAHLTRVGDAQTPDSTASLPTSGGGASSSDSVVSMVWTRVNRAMASS